MNITAYLINRGSLVSLGFEKREELWTQNELKYSDLRTFGYTMYGNFYPEKRDKLDVKVVKYCFISYYSDLFGYKFWDDRNRKILRHCDGTFNGSVMFQKKKKKKSSKTTKQVGVKLEL